MDMMPNVNFAFSSNNKGHLIDLYNYLNQKVITAINTSDGSTLGDNLITSHQVNYMSSTLILTETVENDQEHLVATGEIIHVDIKLVSSQPAITCSKLTIETLEQGVKYVLVSLVLTLNIFHTLF